MGGFHNPDPGNLLLSPSARQAVEIIVPQTVGGYLPISQGYEQIQVDTYHGIPATDFDALTATGGSVTTSGGVATCATGTSVGGYGVLRSRRTAPIQPGSAMEATFDAYFSAGAAQSLQLAGLVTAIDALAFGHVNGVFGVHRRISGSLAIYRLTITAGTGGSETATVRLNGTNFTVPLTGTLTTAQVAEQVAAYGTGYTGWSTPSPLPLGSPQSAGVTVTFIQSTPAATAGTFTFSSTGTAAGTFAQIQAGAANDDSTGFVPQTSWNRDKMDGAGPSGVTLDPTKLNVYRIALSGNGGSTVVFSMMVPGGVFVPVHVLEFPNSGTAIVQRNPGHRVTWIAASLGSMTNITTSGSTGSVRADDESTTRRDPSVLRAQNKTATTSEAVVMAIRVRGELNGVATQRQVKLLYVDAGTETTNRVVSFALVINPTFGGSGTLAWTAHSLNSSAVDVSTPTSVTRTGGQEVRGLTIASGASSNRELEAMDIRLEVGDVLAVVMTAANSTAVCNASIGWKEI